MKLFKENRMEILKSKKVKIIILSVIATLLVIYLGVAWFYSTRFLMGTTINSVDCSEMTVEEVEEYMQSELQKYVLTIVADNLSNEEIHSKDLDIKFTNMNAITEAMEAQNAFSWPVALFQERKVDAIFEAAYDEGKLDKLVEGLACMKEENQKEAIPATPEYKGKEFVIKEEVLGTQINQEKFRKSIVKAIKNFQAELNLREEGCYVAPTFLADDWEVRTVTKLMNKCLETKITYRLDSKTLTLDADLIKDWLSVDEKMNLVLSKEEVSKFAKHLGETFNTKPRTNQFTTPTGKTATVSGATKGRIIGTSAECDRLMEEIPKGIYEVREPIITQHATPEGKYVWGNTYVEVDISAQHMWYIKNGNVIFETDVVTGSPGRDTPSGVFEILTKKRDKILRGNIDPATGKREYETPVDYWARITWTGVGFHDATWQPAFGGQLYRQGYGSHGCINMPYNAVATFYGLISVGDPVVVHY